MQEPAGALAMKEPATAPWGLPISNADLEKLKAGFQPQDQDDKWLVSTTQIGNADLEQLKAGLEPQDKDEKWPVSATYQPISIHVTRSATGIELYVLHIIVKPSDNNSSNSDNKIKIAAITWEQNKGGIHISEEQGKKEVVIITRGILGCDFDALPEYDVSDLWNHPAAQIKR